MGFPKRGHELRKDKRKHLGLEGSVRVHLVVGNDALVAKAIDISAGGIGIITKELREARLPRVGHRVGILYGRGGAEETTVPAVVRNMNFMQVGDLVVVRIGLSFGHDDGVALVPSDKPTVTRAGEKAPLGKGPAAPIPPRAPTPFVETFVPCPSFFRPSAFCEDPQFFQERLHFQVDALSPRSLRLLSPARSLELVQNRTLSLTVFLPLLGTYELKARTHEPRVLANLGVCVLDAGLHADSLSFAEDASRYLILSGAVGDVKTLVDKHFPVKDLERYLHFQLARDDDDRAAAQGFRQAAGGMAGNTDATVAAEAGEHEVLCRLGSEVIGVGRFLFVEAKPGEEAHVRVSWFCGSGNDLIPDAFLYFVKSFARMTLETGHSHMRTSCQVAAVPVFDALGFRVIADGPGDERVLVLDVPGVLSGEIPVHRQVWRKIYEPVHARWKAKGFQRATA